MSGIRMSNMAYARISEKVRFRILFGIRCSVFESLLYVIFRYNQKPKSNESLYSLKKFKSQDSSD
jgi:hypothetical protein